MIDKDEQDTIWAKFKGKKTYRMVIQGTMSVELMADIKEYQQRGTTLVHFSHLSSKAMDVWQNACYASKKERSTNEVILRKGIRNRLTSI